MPHGGDFDPAPTAEGCLSTQRLEEYLRCPDGSSPDKTVLAHLEGCLVCRDRLQMMMDAERFLARFATASVVAASSGEPRLAAEPLPVRNLVIPGYEVFGVVGIGGQGVVYRARQLATDRTVAVKIPLRDTALRPAARYRFQREVELAARLDHPGIVRLLGVCEAADGRVGCVMEYVEGEPFDSWSAGPRAQGRSGVRRIVEMTIRIADAVAYAHQLAVMHRDIKPSNIVITRDGAVRVLDFGLAKGLDDGPGTFATATGAFVGTLAFAAPEQAAGGDAATDLRTDVHAIGVLLYQALTGQLPFDPSAPMIDLLRNIRETAPARPSSLAPFVGHEIDAIILKALAKEKHRRYSSATELRDDLQRWLDDRAVLARGDSLWYVMRKAAVRRKGTLAAVLCGVLMCGAAVSGAGYHLASARAAAGREEYERAKAAAEADKSDAVRYILDELVPLSSEGATAADTPPSLLLARSAPGRALEALDGKLEAGLVENKPRVEAAVRGLLGAVYHDRGALAQAEWQLRQSLRLQLISGAEPGPEFAETCNRLAEVLLGRAKYKEAHERALAALNSRERILGRDHQDVAQSLDTLARVEQEMGDSVGARRHALEARRIFERVGSDESSAAAINLATLARMSIGAGRVHESMELAKRSLAARFRVSQDDHPLVIQTIAMFAEIENASGLSADAERDRLLAAAMAASQPAERSAAVWWGLVNLKRRVLETDETSVAQTLMQCGSARQREGDRAGAVACLRDALGMFERADGPISVRVADCLVPLLGCLTAPAEAEERRSLLRRRYEIYRSSPAGREHLIVVSHRELADFLAWSRRDDDAMLNYAGTLAEIDQLASGDRLERRRALLGMAELRAAQGEDREAAQLHARVLELGFGATQSEAWERGRADFVHGVVLACRGEHESATTLLDGSVQVAELCVETMPDCTWSRMAERLILARARSADSPVSLGAEPGYLVRLKSAIARRSSG